MTVLRKDWVSLPGEIKEGVSRFTKETTIKVRAGGVIDESDSDLRSEGYCGIVPAHQAIGNKENWHISIQDEEKRVKSKTINDMEREKKLMTAEFVPLDDRFWASLDGKPIMSLGEALDSAHGLAVNTFDFSEPMSFDEEEPELEQEFQLEPEPESDRIELQEAIKKWIQERYGKVPEKEIQVFRAHPQIERKKISFNQLKLHCLWSLKNKRPPQKRMLSWRRARRQHREIPLLTAEP